MKLVGGCESITRLRSLLPALAVARTPVLFFGEPGTGREHLARMLHAAGPRAAAPFKVVDCHALLPGAQDDLFDRGPLPGLLRVAAGATLYLRDVDALPFSMQGQLSDHLDKTADELGYVPPRIFASTETNLANMVSRGRFRGELYYALAANLVRMPALAERTADVPMLATHFLAQSGKLLGKRFDGLSGPAAELLMQHHWPGNLDELARAMDRAAVLETGRLLTSSALPTEVVSSQAMYAAG